MRNGRWQLSLNVFHSLKIFEYLNITQKDMEECEVHVLICT